MNDAQQIPGCFRKFGWIFIMLLCSIHVKGQDDLMQMLEGGQVADSEKVMSTFRGNKIVNLQSNETPEKKSLDFRVNHQFGNIGTESGGGVHTLYGLDQSNDIRIALHYGITDRLMAGVSRCKRNENLEGLAKFRLLRQTSNRKIPLSVTLFSNVTLTTKADEFVSSFRDRLTYCSQAIFARKFSPRFSFELVGSFLHRNVVPVDDHNDLYSAAAGLRWKFSGSASVIADYAHSLKRDNLAEKHFDPVGIGVEIETGGHLFTIMFTNASGILENDFLAGTKDDWMKGGMKFSFIISRLFRFGKDKPSPAKS